jgi:hypothetical protein
MGPPQLQRWKLHGTLHQARHSQSSAIYNSGLCYRFATTSNFSRPGLHTALKLSAVDETTNRRVLERMLP